MAEEILISYRVEVDQLKAELKAVQSQLKATESSGKNAAKETSKEFKKAGNDIGSSLKSIAGAIGLAFSVQQVISFGKESIKAFAEAEVNANKLKFAVTQIGKEGQAAFQKLIDQSNKLQDISIFSDDDIQKAQTQLATLGLNSKQIEELIPKVLDLASATGQELGAATDSIIQGINGQTRSLRAVGLEFVATGDKTKNLAILTDNLNKFQGATATALETTAGKTARLQNVFDNLKESIGQSLVNELSGYLDFYDLLSGKISLVESLTKNSNQSIQANLNKFNEATFREASKSEEDRLKQIKLSEERIIQFKKSSAKAKSVIEIESITTLVKNELKLQSELKKINQKTGNGLGGATIDPAIAAKAKEDARKLALEIRDLQASIIEDAKSREIAQLVNKYTDLAVGTKAGDEKLLLLQVKYEQERDAIIKTYKDKEIADNEALFEDAIKVAEASSDEQAKIDLKLYNEKKALRDKDAKDAVQKENEKQAAIKDIQQASFQFTSDLLVALQEIQQNKIAVQIQGVNEAKDAEIAALDKQLEAGLISRDNYDKKRAEAETRYRNKERQLKQEAFESQKEAALINVGIKTAEGIVNALASAPYPYNLVLAAITAAAGAAQIAVINSQPTPKFAKGGKVEGKLHSQGGTLIEAELDEWVIKRNESIKNDSLLDAINKGKGQKYIYEMYVAPALKEQLRKHNTSKDNDFASNIASSMMLNSGQFKDGNILESLKMQRKSDKENIKYLAKVIQQNNYNARNW